MPTNIEYSDPVSNYYIDDLSSAEDLLRYRYKPEGTAVCTSNEDVLVHRGEGVWTPWCPRKNNVTDSGFGNVIGSNDFTSGGSTQLGFSGVLDTPEPWATTLHYDISYTIRVISDGFTGSFNLILAQFVGNTVLDPSFTGVVMQQDSITTLRWRGSVSVPTLPSISVYALYGQRTAGNGAIRQSLSSHTVSFWYS